MQSNSILDSFENSKFSKQIFHSNFSLGVSGQWKKWMKVWMEVYIYKIIRPSKNRRILHLPGLVLSAGHSYEQIPSEECHLLGHTGWCLVPNHWWKSILDCIHQTDSLRRSDQPGLLLLEQPRHWSKQEELSQVKCWISTILQNKGSKTEYMWQTHLLHSCRQYLLVLLIFTQSEQNWSHKDCTEWQAVRIFWQFRKEIKLSLNGAQRVQIVPGDTQSPGTLMLLAIKSDPQPPMPKYTSTSSQQHKYKLELWSPSTTTCNKLERYRNITHSHRSAQFWDIYPSQGQGHSPFFLLFFTALFFCSFCFFLCRSSCCWLLWSGCGRPIRVILRDDGEQRSTLRDALL